jgi:hypothetical protein
MPGAGYTAWDWQHSTSAQAVRLPTTVDPGATVGVRSFHTRPSDTPVLTSGGLACHSCWDCASETSRVLQT